MEDDVEAALKMGRPGIARPSYQGNLPEGTTDLGLLLAGMHRR